MNRGSGGQMNRGIEGQTDRWTNRQTVLEMERWMDRQVDR